MGLKIHQIMNDGEMNGTHSGRERYEFECRHCGKSFIAKAKHARWCPQCRGIIKNRNSKLRMREMYRRKKEEEKLNAPENQEPLVFILRRMWEDCPGSEVEDCDTCFFNQFPYFHDMCPKQNDNQQDFYL